MNGDSFIAADWGTSNLRLYLCEYSASRPAEVVDIRSGPGVNRVAGDFEAIFFDLTDDWVDKFNVRSVIISGMVGSTIGWKEAPYLQCPVNAKDIAKGRLAFSARDLRFYIVAGLKTVNPLGAPDVLRGEELQMLGWMHRHDGDGGRHLIALPGTHNKWVLFENGRIETFLTAPTGELFALLETHSVLINGQTGEGFDETAFTAGLRTAENMNGANLLHALFTTRSRQALGELQPKDASSYLSGLLVGSDIAGATAAFTNGSDKPGCITLIGNEQLSEYYRLALRHYGFHVRICPSVQTKLAGYTAVYRSILEQEDS